MSVPSFGWLPSPADSRDYTFSLPLLGAPAAPDERLWPTGPVLDQGNSKSCVGQSWAAWLLCAPVRTRATSADGIAIWREAAAIDGHGDDWTGGVTGRSGLKAMKARKKVVTYFRTQDAEEVRDYVLSSGPVVFGALWWPNMVKPVNGVMTADGGKFVGGHAVLLRGFKNGHFIVRNSWGADWGVNGEALISLKTVSTLLALGTYGLTGEAWAAKERA